MKQLLIIVALIAAGAGFVIWANRPASAGDGELDEFAQCLASEELTMYGAEWCAHCKNEKSEFSGSFKYVPYVECPDEPKLCIEKGIRGYPTWITKEGVTYEGEQGLEKLSQISGCSLPNSTTQ
jgi:hypothetical protein